MTAITIRIRDDDDRETIERLKATTRNRTAAKALMHAARLYPDAREELRRTLDRRASAQSEQLERLQSALDRLASAQSEQLERLQSALQDWQQRARELERSTWSRLEDIRTRTS